MNDVRVTVVFSRNAETGTKLADDVDARFAPDIDLLLPDVDSIVIATHNDSHGTFAAAALECGRHVLLEYPLARSIVEGERILALAASRRLVLRTTHAESVSASHLGLKRRIAGLGHLLMTHFLRLTPGRGARPDVLFNLAIFGPPALFFVYHVYPIVALFGPVAWVEGSAVYEGASSGGRYERFVNTVTAGFRRGGVGSWTWAGGIEIRAAEESERYVLTGGTVFPERDGWRCSTRSGVETIPTVDKAYPSLPELWLDEVRSGDNRAALTDTGVALDAIRLSLSAERAMNEGCRVVL